MKVYSLKKYAQKVGYPHYKKETTLQEMQDYFEGDLWDYPLEELEYCIEECKKVVIVKTDFGLRLCEIDQNYYKLAFIFAQNKNLSYL